MKGLLIYQKEDLQRNTWFAQRLCAEANTYGIELLAVTVGQLLPSMQPNFVINRSRNAAISQTYVAQGIRCFNHSSVTQITNDKWLTHCFLQQHGIPVAETTLHTPTDTPPSAYPIVVKPCDGHGGAGVHLVQNKESYSTVAAQMPSRFLVQQPMVYGWDLRVYVLGGKLYAAMLRTSQTDFRSNFSLGGNAHPSSPDASLRSLVEQVAAALPLDFVGVDLLRHPNGGYVIGEIEDAVGCRMLYQHTHLDPAADYMAYIAEQVAITPKPLVK